MTNRGENIALLSCPTRLQQNPPLIETQINDPITKQYFYSRLETQGTK